MKWPPWQRVRSAGGEVRRSSGDAEAMVKSGLPIAGSTFSLDRVRVSL